MVVSNNPHALLVAAAVMHDQTPLPFKDFNMGTGVMRTFDKSTCESDLVWHTDTCDRKITPLVCDGWQFQFDNDIPFNMVPEQTFIVPSGVFHRLLKGKKTELIIFIEEC